MRSSLSLKHWKLWRGIAALMLFIHPGNLKAQVPEASLRKLSPSLQKQTLEKSRVTSNRFMVVVDNLLQTKNTISRDVKIIYEYTPVNILVVQASWKEVVEKILPLKEVSFVDILRTPKEEVAVSNLDLGTNKVNLMHAAFPQYNGNTTVVSIKEGQFDIDDIDFKGRYLRTIPLTDPPLISSHATIMATVIGGGGNSYYEGKGVGWGTTVSSTSFTILLPEPDTFYQRNSINVQNHSYGTGIENYYGADAAAYDATVIARPSLLQIFSAGNSGTQPATTGVYANIPGFANLTGSFKMAKNIITVGHIDSFYSVLPLSSRGPAFDGRVRPELVAFSEDGSSGAAAIVSGISLTLQQAYKEINGVAPSSALVKAVLLNTADDVDKPGIDYNSGYGTANAYKAMQSITSAKHFTGNIATGGDDVFNLTIPAGIRQLKLTLVWIDPPANVNASKALRNDLDLELFYAPNSQYWQPWVLSHFPNIDSLKKLPVRKRDSVNNVEQITIENPVAGNYQVHVRGFNVTPSSPQNYYVAYQVDSLDKFTWCYPTKQDNIFSGAVNLLRWESSYSNTTAQLEYSINNGNTWNLIDNTIDLKKGYYKWPAPDSFVTALVRMNFAPQSFVTDTFTISKRQNVFVGFNCTDSFMLYWNKIPGISSYRLYRLADKYMESLLIETDTAVILAKQSNPSLYYAIAPVINNKTGVRSYAYNYTTQGVACYIKTFLGLLVNNTAKLELELGTVYNIKTISWQKLGASGFISLQEVNIFPSNDFNYTDNPLTKGVNTYRVKIELQNGKIIYSENVSVYYFMNSTYIVYPNPAQQFENVQVLSNDASFTRLQVFNSVGVKVFEKNLDDLVNIIPAGKLSKGFYVLRIMKDDKLQSLFKLVVY